MNREIVELLNEFSEIMEIEGELYRSRAYKRASDSIKKLQYDIRIRPPDLRENKIPAIGAGIIDKLNEYIRTGKIRELEKLRQSRSVRAFREFSGILGVGPVTIRDWIAMRIYNLPALRRAVARGRVVLNNTQKLGLKYYVDLNQRIPRHEVETLGKTIQSVLNFILPGVVFEISGSYRRGRSDSGDIDIIITHRNWQRDLLQRFRKTISQYSQFIDVISAGEQRLTFLYLSDISGRARQIDLLWIPPENYWASVCYFTGSGNFNEYLRGVAKKRGYRLNQMGLYRIHGRELTIVPVKNEREIFDILEVPYRAPEERDI